MATDFREIYTDFANPLEDFYKAVRSTNVLIKTTSSGDIDDVASYQAIPRIGLILSAAKNLDNTFLFPGDDAQARFDAISSQMIEGVYSSGIRRVASALTASILIRNIPLSGNINQLALGDSLEKQALDDLDRIINLFQNTSTVQSLDSSSASLIDSIYISLGIVPESLKALDPNLSTPGNPVFKSGIDIFDILDPNKSLEENNLDEDGSSKYSVPTEGTLTYKRVPYLGPNKSAYCYFSLSTLDDGITPGPKSIEGCFYIPSDSSVSSTDGWSSSQIIDKLADSINSATLSSSISNILVSPNLGSLTVSSISIRKSRLFPDVDSYSIPFINQFRKAVPTVGYKVHSLTFDVRRYSNIVQNELITIIFYTVNSSSTTLTPFDVRSNSTLGVKGLWFGTNSTYTSLDEPGPHSLLIQISKGKSTTTGSSSTLTKPTYEKEKDLLYPDTFYFRFSDSSRIDPLLQLYQKPISSVSPPLKPTVIPPVSGLLRWRASSTPSLSSDLPIEYSFDTSDILDSPTDPLAPEKIARAFIDSLYNFTSASSQEQAKLFPNALLRSSPPSSSDSNTTKSSSSNLVTAPNQGNNLLGALVHPNAVQIIPFRSIDFNSKAVIDILEVPTNIEIATGTPLFFKSVYLSGPRSIVVDSIPMKTKLSSSSSGGDGSSNLSDKDILDDNPSTAQGVRSNKSPLLQSVYDRLNFLNSKDSRGLYR